MEITLLQIGDMAVTLSNLVTPLIVVSLTYIFSVWIKDSFTRIARGLLFKMNDQFNEGDKVIIDGENAIIVKMGIYYTVFGIHKSNGHYTWRYVPNEMIHMLKIEKMVFIKYE